ncbi:uncharacterized protein LOC132935160 [Metopolophium dirhodum]|uniref:uncharacterized protein LOC132935160 n=1 Tax=Metopolophium dirhodum TaxID=44670 RepID=UPI00298FF37F|nr:uncharacterized protein LOC132935160 [Metopolophium dirhodum]
MIVLRPPWSGFWTAEHVCSRAESNAVHSQHQCFLTSIDTGGRAFKKAVNLGLDLGLPNIFVRVRNRMSGESQHQFFHTSIDMGVRAFKMAAKMTHSISNLIHCFHILLWLW